MRTTYRQNHSFHGLTWVRGRELEVLPDDRARSLAGLGN